MTMGFNFVASRSLRWNLNGTVIRGQGRGRLPTPTSLMNDPW